MILDPQTIGSIYTYIPTVMTRDSTDVDMFRDAEKRKPRYSHLPRCGLDDPLSLCSSGQTAQTGQL
jgi:hypothetical protein